MRDEVVAAVAGAPRAVAVAGTSRRMEAVEAEEATTAPVVSAVVATAVVVDLMAAVGGAAGRATSGRIAPPRRVTSSRSVQGARILATGRAHAHCVRQ